MIDLLERIYIVDGMSPRRVALVDRSLVLSGAASRDVTPRRVTSRHARWCGAHMNILRRARVTA